MGTGTHSDGGHRPTPARRAFHVALALVGVFTATLAGAAPAMGADPWSREVRFPNPENADPPLVQYSCDYAVENPCDQPAFDVISQPAMTITAAHSGLGGAPAKGDGKLTHTEATDSTVTRVALPVDPDWPIVFEWDASRTHLSCNSGCAVTFTAHWYTGSWVPGTPGGFTSIGSTAAPAVTFTSNVRQQGSYIWQDAEGGGSIPANATGVLITSSPEVSMYGFRLTTHAGAVEGGGDCIGVAGAGTDAGLVWGAAGLTSSTHDQWGDLYSPVREACVFTSGGAYVYEPPEGIPAGNTFHIAAEFFTHTGGTARFASWWNTASGNVPIAQQVTQSITADATSARIMAVDAPPGATGITLVFTDKTWLQAVYIANVEGDPVLDNGSNPSTWGDGFNEGDRFADCNPPEDALDVAGWLAFVACLLINGFLMVVEWIAAIPGDLAAVLGGVIGPVVMDWTAAAVAFGAGVVGALMAPLGDLLEALFVPGPSLGDAWDEFMDMVGSRVPFGWFAQVSDAISAGMAAPAGALGTYTLTIGTASVSIGGAVTAALGAVAPFRGLLLAGVALVMVLGCLRWIMAAVGVSPAHAGGDGASS